MKRKNKDVNTFKNDLIAFGESAAGHLPGIGKALGAYDTYKKGKRLTVSGPKAMKAVKRQVKSRINRSIRRVQRYLP